MHKMTLLSKLTITLSENGNYFMSTIFITDGNFTSIFLDPYDIFGI